MTARRASNESLPSVGLMAASDTRLERSLRAVGARIAFADAGLEPDPHTRRGGAEAVVVDLDGLGEAAGRRFVPWARRQDDPLLCVGSSDEHALLAFEAGAAAYLARPYDGESVGRALASLARRHAAIRRAPLLAEIARRAAERRRSAAAARRIALRRRGTIHIVSIDSILWIRARRNDIELQTADRSLRARFTLRAIAERLAPRGFVRIDRSLVVRRPAVLGLVSRRERGGELLFVGGRRLGVSSGQVPAIERAFSAPAGSVGA